MTAELNEFNNISSATKEGKMFLSSIYCLYSLLIYSPPRTYFIAPKCTPCTGTTFRRVGCLRRCSSGFLQLHLLNERLESLHEILNAQFFALPLLIHAGDLLWWNKKATNYLDDSVFGDTIFDNHLGESVYFDADDAAKAENIDA